MGLFFETDRNLVMHENALPHYGQGSTHALHYNPAALWRPRIEFGNSSRDLREYFPVTIDCFSVFDRAPPRSVTCSGGGRGGSTFHHDPSVAKSLASMVKKHSSGTRVAQ
jgi:hypothetical protein